MGSDQLPHSNLPRTTAVSLPDFLTQVEQERQETQEDEGIQTTSVHQNLISTGEQRDSDGSGGSSSTDMDMRIEQPYQPKVEVRIVPDDGCVILGKDEHSCTCDYATRYHIASRDLQCDDVNGHVIYDDVIPCCNPTIYTCKDTLWSFIRSELFLLHLHMIVIILGVMKVFLHDEYTNRNLHLIYAVLETTFACSILIIRAFVGKDLLQDVKESRLVLEYVKTDTDSRNCIMRLWTFIQFTVSFLLCTIIIGSFVLCYVYLNLGWTILTNNLSITIAIFMSIIMRERVSRVIYRIREDHYKIVILESSLLLGEMYWIKQDDQHKDTRNKVERFLRGLKNTAALQKPAYIDCGEDLCIDIVTNRESGL